MKTVQVLKNAITPAEIAQLVDYYSIGVDKDQRPDHQSKNCPVDSDDWPKILTDNLLKRALGQHAGIERAFYLEKNHESYYHIHVDTYYDEPVEDVGNKYNILIPLEIEGMCTTVFFDNYWSGAMAKFTQKNISRFSYYLKDSTGEMGFVYDLNELLSNLQNGNTMYGGHQWSSNSEFVKTIKDLIHVRSGSDNRPIIKDYSLIENFNDMPFDRAVYDKYLSGMNYNDFHGLTLDQAVEWELGDIIVFNKTQLHTVGTTHKRKLHYTVFTR
jgi:hypothetical protein